MAKQTWLVLLTCASVANCAKLLTVALMGGSHTFMMDEISNILASGGHNVFNFHQMVYLLDGPKTTRGNYTYIPWTIGGNYPEMHRKVKQAFAQNALRGEYSIHWFLTILNLHAYECDELLSDSEVLTRLRNENFDLLVIEAFHFCTLLLAEKLKVPFVAVYGTSSYNARYIHMPSNPSYVPAFMSHLSDSMTFLGRLQNAWVLLRNYFEGQMCFNSFNNVIRKHFSGEDINLEDLHHKAELWIYNTGFSLEYPRPLLPNVVFVGSYLSKPAEPLPQEMEDYLTGDQGFIIVALGTMVESIADRHLIEKMTRAFSRFPQKFIWRFNNNSWPSDISLPDNVKIYKWLPQNDLLGHPQVRAFISHGGINSLHQAVYHGVPVLGLALFYDQLDNIIRLESKGMALRVSVRELEEETLVTKLTQLLTIPSFKQSALRTSKQLRFQPFTAAELTNRWIESILKVGSGEHLKPHSYQMPTYQLYLLDICGFALAAAVLIIFCAYKVLRSLIHQAMARFHPTKAGEKQKTT
ncbi:UDP-glucuronosyltransferase 3A1-like [Pristis pectinata]|uniref:UDP-glucuronosyltransferase 3A1-like n=1 Tax=Pristis pectinata TaxID=685728 RepID=UPI00223CACF3|nr:UDP-glucuronosyltransferase 3A1-like [Pristis pectinata]